LATVFALCTTTHPSAATALDQGASEIKAAEAQLALARGRFLHARFFVDHEDRPEQLDQLTKATELFP